MSDDFRQNASNWDSFFSRCRFLMVVPSFLRKFASIANCLYSISVSFFESPNGKWLRLASNSSNTSKPPRRNAQVHSNSIHQRSQTSKKLNLCFYYRMCSVVTGLPRVFGRLLPLRRSKCLCGSLPLVSAVVQADGYLCRAPILPLESR